MLNRYTKKIILGLSILMALAVLALFVHSPLHEGADDGVTDYQDESVPEIAATEDVLAKPSSGELAHNQHYFGLGRLGNGDYKGAIEKFVLATELDPGNAEYHTNLAIAYEKDGQYDNALGRFKIALSFRPKSSDLLSWLGGVHFSKKQWKGAAEAYDKAIGYGAKDSGTFFNAAQVYLEMGALAKAMDTIDAAIALNKNDADYYIISGIIRHSFMKYKEAIHAFELARMINPDKRGIDEWVADTRQKIREMDLTRAGRLESTQADRYPRGSSAHQKRKIDEIYLRMEKLKEDFRNKQR